MKFNNVRKAIPIILMALILSFSSLAESTPIGDRNDLPSGLETINFDDLAVGTYVTDQYYSEYEVEFSGGGINFFAPGQVLYTTPGRNAGIVAVFNEENNVTTVGVDFSSISNVMTLRAIGYSGNEFEVSLNNPNQGTPYDGFLGLSINEAIYTVKIHDSGLEFAIDNFSFGPTTSAIILPVPEAGTLMLLGGGLLGLGFFRKKLKL